MQYSESIHATGPLPGEAAIGKAKRRLSDIWPKFARRAAAIVGATAAFATPLSAQAQGHLSIDAPITPAVTDINNPPHTGTINIGTLQIDIPDIVETIRNPFSSHGYLGDIFGTAAPRGPVYAALQMQIDAPAWQGDARFAELVLDANTGEIIYERNGLEARHLASMNKVMTAYLVFEAMAEGRLTPDTVLTASAYAASQGGMSMNLRRGQQVTVAEALDQLITVSANDAAVLLAEGVAGSEEAFAARMTETAQRLGAVNTTFASASGRFGDDSTAYDMTLIFRAVGNDYPAFYQRYFTDNCTWCETTDIHATGRKTGTRSVAGYNVVVRIEHEGRDYIVVTMGARNNPGRFGRAIELAHAVWETAPPTPFGAGTYMAAATSAAEADDLSQGYAYSASIAALRPGS